MAVGLPASPVVPRNPFCVGTSDDPIELHQGVEQAADAVDRFIVGFARMPSQEASIIEPGHGLIGHFLGEAEEFAVAGQRMEVQEKRDRAAVVAGVGSLRRPGEGILLVPSVGVAGARREGTSQALGPSCVVGYFFAWRAMALARAASFLLVVSFTTCRIAAVTSAP